MKEIDTHEHFVKVDALLSGDIDDTGQIASKPWLEYLPESLAAVPVIGKIKTNQGRRFPDLSITTDLHNAIGNIFRDQPENRIIEFIVTFSETTQDNISLLVRSEGSDLISTAATQSQYLIPTMRYYASRYREIVLIVKNNGCFVIRKLV